MKYVSIFLALLLFFFSSFAPTSSQIIESDYVREGHVESEVLGVETVEEERVETEEEELGTYEMIDIFAVLGGVVVIILVAYIVYSKKED